MARTKSKPRVFAVPKDLPAGVRIVKVPKKLHGKDGPTTTLLVVAPEESGEGILAYQKMYEAARTKDGKNPDPDANVLLARAMLASAADSQAAAVKAGTSEEPFAGYAFPKAPKVRALDPMDAYLEAQKAFIVQHRRPPTNDEAQKMYTQFFG